jgi:hypothetical protein
MTEDKKEVGGASPPEEMPAPEDRQATIEIAMTKDGRIYVSFPEPTCIACKMMAGALDKIGDAALEEYATAKLMAPRHIVLPTSVNPKFMRKG